MGRRKHIGNAQLPLEGLLEVGREFRRQGKVGLHSPALAFFPHQTVVHGAVLFFPLFRVTEALPEHQTDANASQFGAALHTDVDAGGQGITGPVHAVLAPCHLQGHTTGIQKTENHGTAPGWG